MNDSEAQQTWSDEKTGTPHSLRDVVNRKVSIVSRDGEVVNASGHRDQLQRQYSLLSICGLALTIDNAWVALGGSIAVSICKLSSIPERLVPFIDSQTTVDPLAFSMNSWWLACTTRSLLRLLRRYLPTFDLIPGHFLRYPTC